MVAPAEKPMRLPVIATVLLALALLAPVPLRAEEPAAVPFDFLSTPEAAPPDGALPELRRSLPKALTYQGIVIATDQLLYWAIVGGTMEDELEFLAGNAITGIAYYVAFDEMWHATGLDTPGEASQLNVTKGLAYRVFDTARVFGVTLAVGTTLADSIEVSAAIAVTRTAIYVLHDYVWYWATKTEAPPRL